MSFGRRPREETIALKLGMRPRKRLPPPDVERRAEDRRRVVKRGEIRFMRGTFSVDVVIRDQTADGARLEVPLDATIPDAFDLAIPVEMRRIACAVTWREPGRMGVRFLGPVTEG